MLSFVLFRWLALLFLFSRYQAENYQVKSVCLSEKPRSMSISCPSNKITRILKAYYGYSWSGDCHFIEKDCIVDVPNEDLSCLGEGCSVKIIDSPIILQECWNLMASYIQIDYECIPVEELQNMCNIQESEKSVGYIVTPNYPSYLDMDLSCPCTLSAPKGSIIAVEVLDFRLPSCSQAGLTLWSDSSTYTHCLTISGGVLPGSESQNISMRLHSEARRLNAGFLLKYLTKPVGNVTTKIKFVCYGSMTNWNIKNSTQKLIVERPTPPQNVLKPRPKNETVVNNGFFIRKSKIEAVTRSEVLKEEGSNQQSSVAKSKEKAKDWTAIIISIIASVVFLLVLINALIWFIFSIKREGGVNTQKISKPNENYYPPCNDFYKVNFQGEEQPDIYSANSVNGIYNTSNTSNFVPRQKLWNKFHPYGNSNPEIITNGLEQFYTDQYMPGSVFGAEFVAKPRPKEHFENNERIKNRYRYELDSKYLKHNVYEPHQESHQDSEYSVIGHLPSFNNCKNKLMMNKTSLTNQNPSMSFQHSYHPASWLNGF